jgi:hypothetical protein
VSGTSRGQIGLKPGLLNLTSYSHLFKYNIEKTITVTRRQAGPRGLVEGTENVPVVLKGHGACLSHINQK